MVGTSIIKRHKGIVITAIVFGAVFSLISLTNNYLFRTFALDLGVFNQALHQASRFQFPTYSLSIVGVPEINFFTDHFSPAFFFFTPLYYIFGNYTCLVVQILSILIGGITTYRIALLQDLGKFSAVAASILFFGTWGVVGALSFDFHMNVVGAMLVPLVFYFHLTEKRMAFVITCIFIALCKENMALWLAAIVVGLLIMDMAAKKKPAYILMISLACALVIYFFAVIGVFMPALHPDKVNNQLNRFLDTGTTLGERISELLLHPMDTVRMMWLGSQGQVSIDKTLLHFMTLISGGVVWLWRPWLFVMVLPVYAQKFLSGDDLLWGIHGQYSIEFVPVIAFGVIMASRDLPAQWRRWFVLFFALMAMYVTHTELLRNTPNARFFDAGFYSSGLDRQEVIEAIDKVTPGKISAMSALAPHLADKGILYHYPRVFDADQIILLKCCRSVYPLTEEDFMTSITEYRSNGQWSVVYESEQVVLLKKKR